MARSNGRFAFSMRRTSAEEINVDAAISGARAFGSSIKQCQSVTLIAKMEDDSSLSSIVLIDGTKHEASKAANTIAEAVNAAATPLDDLPELDAEVVGVVRPRNADASLGRNSAAGADPGALARHFAANAAPGEWVAMTLGEYTPKAKREYTNWVRMSGGSDSHYSGDPSSLCANIVVGSDTKAGAINIGSLVMSQLPGFDLDTEVSFNSIPVGMIAGGVAALAGGALAVMQPVIAASGTTISFRTGAPMLGAEALGCAGASVFAAHSFGMLRSGNDKARDAATNLSFTRPSTKVNRSVPEVEGKSKEKIVYPLSSPTLLITPVMAASIVAPSSDESSGSMATRGRGVPPALRKTTGILIGHDANGNPAHLANTDLYDGIAIFGKPGSGKSVALRVCLGYNIAERVAPSGRHEAPGRSNTIIVFENKGRDGAERSLAYFKALGDDVTLIDLADANTPAIEMFDRPGAKVHDLATAFIDAMVYAFGESSIQGRSRETLNAILPAAIVLSREGHGGVMPLAHTLCLGQGEEGANRLYQTLNDIRVAGGDNAMDAGQCIDDLGILFGPGMTAASRKTQAEAARNKLDDLRRVEAWWLPERARWSWRDILDQHKAIILNLGSSTNPACVKVSEEQVKRMSSMLLFLLRDAIWSTCDGWRDQGRSVSIFADELAVLAGDNPTIISTMRDQGRSFGIRTYFATQYPEQLSGPVQDALLNYATKLWMRLTNPRSVSFAVDDLSASGHVWTSADVSSIPNYHGALRTSVDGAGQSPCLVKVGYWEDDLSTFASAQGYDIAPPDDDDRDRDEA